MQAQRCSVWLLLVHYGLALKLEDARRQQPETLRMRGKRGFAELSDTCWDSDVWGESPFHLTQKMCRRSYIHHGDIQKGDAVQSMLHTGQCITVAVLGGSVSAGVCASCPDGKHAEGAAWPNQLKKWLDTRFPCKGEGGHTVDSYSDANWMSEVHVGHTQLWRSDPTHPFWGADMVIVESAVDDDGTYHGWGDWGLDNAEALTPFQRVRAFTEILARELGNAPRKPWLLWAELGWRDFEPEKPAPGHKDANLWHLPMLQYYDIDQVSMVDAFLPLSTTARREWLRDNFFADSSNPSELGHKMCAQIIAHAIMHNSHLMNLEVKERLSWFEVEETEESAPLEISGVASGIYAYGRPDNYTFTRKQDKARLLGDTFLNQTMNVTIMKSKMEAPPEVELPSDETEFCGFNITDDPDIENRLGLVATKVKSRARLLLQLSDTRVNKTVARVNVGLLKSYEHMGIAKIHYGMVQKNCSLDLFSEVKYNSTPEIDCLWSVMSSTRHGEEFMVNRFEGEENCLLLEIEVKEADPPRKENKVKVMDVQVM